MRKHAPGVPISDFLILDSVVGADRDGRPMLDGSTHAARSPGVTFFAVDVETGVYRGSGTHVMRWTP